jgi:hypothetical protein
MQRTIGQIKAALSLACDQGIAAGERGDAAAVRAADEEATALYGELKTAQRHDAISRIGLEQAEPLLVEGPLLTQLKSSGFDPLQNLQVQMGSVLRTKASSFPADTVDELPSVRGPFVGLTRDTRYVYPSLPSAPLGDNLAVSEYVETSAPSVTGSVERDPLDTSEKATLEVSFDYAAEKAKQLAVVVPDIPNAILNSFPAFSGLINDRMQRELDESADAHVLAQVDASGPDGGGSGSDMIADLRNGVAAMRDKGANPTIAAIAPDDAAALDLTQVGADNLYLFSLRSTGDSSPLFGLRFVEAKNVSPGTVYLIDPNVLGVLYEGTSRFLADPYTKMSKNLTSLRLEQDALFHVRNGAGVYIVGGS